MATIINKPYKAREAKSSNNKADAATLSSNQDTSSRDQDIVDEATAWYNEAMDATSTQRNQVDEDLRFTAIGASKEQWDLTERQARENDPGGSRPCLTLDQIDQCVENTSGEIKESPPSIHALPSGGGAEKEVAEQLDGMFRAIEYKSNAIHHYLRAARSACRAGVGYLIVRPVVVDRALNYQEPVISSEGDPTRVMYDPWSVAVDGSDAQRCQLLTSLSIPEFERQFGKDAEQTSFGDITERSTDDRKSIVVCEEWRVEEKTKKMVIFTDAEGGQASLPEDQFEIALNNGEQLQYNRTYNDKVKCVKWVRISGSEILTKETEFPSKHVGIVPVYGYLGFSDSRLEWCGIGRKARQAQRDYNYAMSEIKAYIQSAPKAPWLIPLRGVTGLEELWDRASLESRSWLPWHDINPTDGNPVQRPERAQAAISLQHLTNMAETAKLNIQAATGIYLAQIGAPSNETSGVAIESRKSQSRASTNTFSGHLSASVAHVGKICFDVIQRVVDTKREMRILGIDHTPGAVTINPGQQQAVQHTPKGISINPNVGDYGVRVVAGSNFTTQRQQAVQALTEVMKTSPQVAPAVLPLWASNLDIPNADKLAQVFTALAPDPVKAILQPNPSESPEALKAQMQQLQQALQQATQIAHEAQADHDASLQKMQEMELDRQDQEDQTQIKAYEALTKRLEVELKANAMRIEQAQAIAERDAQAIAQQSQPITPDADDANQANPQAAMQAQATTPANQPAQQVSGDASQEIQPDVAQSNTPAEPMQPEQPDPHIEELMSQQEHLAQLMEMLIRSVNAPRKRTPVRGADGSILHVNDTVEPHGMPTTEPQEGDVK